MERLLAILRDASTAIVLVVLVLAIYLLPPDTSLDDVRQAGVLRVCLPEAYPPLVTGDPANPGLDVELLTQIADRMGVRLDINTNPAMGRDFNPRNWRVTRTQCQLLAGGTVDSSRTRSFLDVSQAYLHTGWAVFSPQADLDLNGAKVGFYPGISGLDRITLSQFLRDQQAQVSVLPSMAEIVAKVETGELDGGVGELLAVTEAAETHGWSVQQLPPPNQQYRLVIGLWRGDLTLKRRVNQLLGDLKRDGTLGQLAAKYHVVAAVD